MLIALLLGYLFLGGGSSGSPWFFGGHSSHQMSKEVARIEPDNGKRKQIDETLKQIEKETKNLESQRSKLERDTLKALEDHRTTAEQFHELTQQADEINTGATKTLLDLRFTLRGQLSDAQWRQLFPPKSTATPD